MTEYFHKLLEQMIKINSCTGLEKEIAEVLCNYHQGHNYHCSKQDIEIDRFNLFAKSLIQSTKRILFSSHIDTVPPHLEYNYDNTNKIYYGRGACDTKGGIIAMLIAAEKLSKENIAVDFLWVIGEETNHIGAIKALEFAELIKEKYLGIILCEPTDNQLVRSQKGILKAKIICKGKNAHSGYPSLGVDANKISIALANSLYSEAEGLSDEIFGSLDLNIGLLSGGQAANVISDYAEFTFLARTNSHHLQFQNYVESLSTESIQIHWLTNYQAFEFKHCESIDFLNHYVAKFNTDAVFLSQLANVYLLGPGYIIYAHSENEHISQNDIDKGAINYINLSKYLYDNI